MRAFSCAGDATRVHLWCVPAFLVLVSCGGRIEVPPEERARIAEEEDELRARADEQKRAASCETACARLEECALKDQQRLRARCDEVCSGLDASQAYTFELCAKSNACVKVAAREAIGFDEIEFCRDYATRWAK